VSTHSRRIKALKVLVAGATALATHPARGRIVQELDEVSRARSVSANHRQRVLQILHTTRALDSTLSVFTSFHRCAPKRAALGSYLHELTRHTSPTLGSRLSLTDRARFQADIVDVRNHYMHEAGAYPVDDTEVRTLLSDMQDCLITILAL
jgi:hypothetical protein